MSSITEWCLHKEADWVEVTVMGEAHRTYMDPACGKSRAEHTKRCPRCGDEIPEENDATGEGPVYWTITGEDFCSMECVIWTHRIWLKTAEGQKAQTDGRL
jgi:hypothetical protein